MRVSSGLSDSDPSESEARSSTRHAAFSLTLREGDAGAVGAATGRRCVGYSLFMSIKVKTMLDLFLGRERVRAEDDRYLGRVQGVEFLNHAAVGGV